MKNKATQPDQLLKAYKSIDIAKRVLDGMFVTLGFTPQERGSFCKDPSRYRYSNPNLLHQLEFSRTVSSSAHNGLYHAMYACVEEIRECRELARRFRNSSIFDDASADTYAYATSIIAANFPKMRMDRVNVVKNVGDYIEKKVSSYFGTTYTINMPLTWCRAVHDKGISVVTDGSKPHMILKATERKLDRLKSDNVRAFKCLTMTGTGGTPILHDAWVMQWNSGTATISALHADFAKAESLLRRRIRKQVTDALLDL